MGVRDFGSGLRASTQKSESDRKDNQLEAVDLSWLCLGPGVSG